MWVKTKNLNLRNKDGSFYSVHHKEVVCIWVIQCDYWSVSIVVGGGIPTPLIYLWNLIKGKNSNATAEETSCCMNLPTRGPSPRLIGLYIRPKKDAKRTFQNETNSAIRHDSQKINRKENLSVHNNHLWQVSCQERLLLHERCSCSQTSPRKETDAWMTDIQTSLFWWIHG